MQYSDHVPQVGHPASDTCRRFAIPGDSANAWPTINAHTRQNLMRDSVDFYCSEFVCNFVGLKVSQHGMSEKFVEYQSVSEPPVNFVFSFQMRMMFLLLFRSIRMFVAFLSRLLWFDANFPIGKQILFKSIGSIFRYYQQISNKSVFLAESLNEIQRPFSTNETSENGIRYNATLYYIRL